MNTEIPKHIKICRNCKRWQHCSTLDDGKSGWCNLKREQSNYNWFCGQWERFAKDDIVTPEVLAKLIPMEEEIEFLKETLREVWMICDQTDMPPRLFDRVERLLRNEDE